ncbi:hypothetical protein [Streptomyces sp. NPDC048341]|uniref:hypothetical protein n=1 Tax=unclassified Streptomyces TaxID=2593676 RepID=UPI00343C6869
MHGLPQTEDYAQAVIRPVRPDELEEIDRRSRWPVCVTDPRDNPISPGRCQIRTP